MLDHVEYCTNAAGINLSMERTVVWWHGHATSYAATTLCLVNPLCEAQLLKLLAQPQLCYCLGMGFCDTVEVPSCGSRPTWHGSILFQPIAHDSTALLSTGTDLIAHASTVLNSCGRSIKESTEPYPRCGVRHCNHNVNVTNIILTVDLLSPNFFFNNFPFCGYYIHCSLYCFYYILFSLLVIFYFTHLYVYSVARKTRYLL